MDQQIPAFYDQMINVQDEQATMSKGRIVKARFPDQPVPNVRWFWLPIGNCAICRFYQPPEGGRPQECAHPRVSDAEFQRYLVANNCPYHETGENARMVTGTYEGDMLDVMRAVGLVSGMPSQRVEVLQDLPWTAPRSQRAHGQQAHFVLMAWEADQGKDYGDHYEQVLHHSNDLGPIYEHEGEVPESEE